MVLRLDEVWNHRSSPQAAKGPNEPVRTKRYKLMQADGRAQPHEDQVGISDDSPVGEADLAQFAFHPGVHNGGPGEKRCPRRCDL